MYGKDYRDEDFTGRHFLVTGRRKSTFYSKATTKKQIKVIVSVRVNGTSFSGSSAHCYLGKKTFHIGTLSDSAPFLHVII